VPRIAYACPGATSMAHTPVPAYDGRNLGPWQAGAQVSGQPGTRAVPAAPPDFGTAGLTVNGLSVRGGGAGYASGSGTMRSNTWYPSVYYERALTGSTLTVPGQGPAVWSDNQMPVPAADPYGRAAVLARPPVFLGQKNLRQPAGSKGPRWPDWLPRMGYGG
jgi:hypothetical protein